jgi:hypothetical protein
VSVNILNRRIIMTPALASGGTAPLGLQTNLAAFWEFENTSWIDATGNTTGLTGNGSPVPTTTSGIVGNAVQCLTANSQFLSHATDPAYDTAGVDFSLLSWFFLPTSNTGAGILARAQSTTFPQNGFSLGVGFNGTGFQAGLNIYANGNNNALWGNTFGNLTTGTWYMVVATVTGASTVMKISVNNSAFDTTTNGNAINSVSQPFYIGAGPTGAPSGNDVNIDQTGIWKNRILSTSDVNLLWNGGAGLTYAQMA